MCACAFISRLSLPSFRASPSPLKLPRTSAISSAKRKGGGGGNDVGTNAGGNCIVPSPSLFPPPCKERPQGGDGVSSAVRYGSLRFAFLQARSGHICAVDPRAIVAARNKRSQRRLGDSCRSRARRLQSRRSNHFAASRRRESGGHGGERRPSPPLRRFASPRFRLVTNVERAPCTTTTTSTVLR